MVLGKLEIHMQQKKLNAHLSPCTKLNSKWIKDLRIKPEILCIIEEKVGPNLHHVGLGPNFLNKTPIAQELKSRINKWDGIKLKSFFLGKKKYSTNPSHLLILNFNSCAIGERPLLFFKYIFKCGAED